MSTLESKLESLIRFHRRHVFDERSGDAHHRAILRLKRTRTWAAMIDERERASKRRWEAQMDRLGY